MCASRWALSTDRRCASVWIRSLVSSSSAANRFSNGRGFSPGGAQSKSITGGSPCDLSSASHRRTASSTASRRSTADFPPQRHGLARLEVIAGHSDQSIAGVVSAHQVLGRRDLGPVGLLFDGGAVQEHLNTAVANVQGEVAGIPPQSLPPVMIVDELPATAEVRDGGHLSTLDPRRDVTGELRQIIHVVSPLDRHPTLIGG